MVEELRPGMTAGVWLIVTQGSSHVFDLDEMTYTRIRGVNRAAFVRDGETVRLVNFEIWPREGRMFRMNIEVDGTVYWRQSSEIRSIDLIGGWAEDFGSHGEERTLG